MSYPNTFLVYSPFGDFIGYGESARKAINMTHKVGCGGKVYYKRKSPETLVWWRTDSDQQRLGDGDGWSTNDPILVWKRVYELIK